MKYTTGGLHRVAIGLAMLGLGCQLASKDGLTAVETTRPADAAALTAEPAAEPAVIGVRHLLLRHTDAQPSVPFGPAEVRFSQAPARSRAEAERLAGELAAQLQARPELFSQTARLQSDDEFTRELGGTLGGMAPSQFRPWPTVRETLLQLQPGRVSGVVESSAGFHIFLREPPPPAALLSGARIVIGYDAASWLHLHGARPGRAAVKRSRAEALELATAVYGRLRDRPELFAQAVNEYSDHRDASRGGDFGQWSTEEASAHPRETAILQQLQVGQIHPPIDSMLGFEIIQRTPNTARETYAMSAIQLRFDPAAPAGTAFSRAVVAEKAASLAREAAADPARFDALREQHCCSRIKVWSSGRGSPALEVALGRLAINDIAREPVEVDRWFIIPQRVRPDSAR